MAVAQFRLHPGWQGGPQAEPEDPNLPARLDRSDRWDQCAIHCSCSDATFQSSALVWFDTGPEAPGGINSETTSWI